jgi:hypothetical protein
MARKWLVRSAALLVLLTSVGCRSWCDRHYGTGCCAPSSYASPQCCCPPPQCCCPPAANYSPPPPPAPAGTWNQPRGCTCP